MGGLLQFTTALVVIGLFTIALIGFATNFAEDNNAAIDLSDDAQITALDTNIKSNTSSFREGSESTYQSIIESSIESGETTPSGGQFAITPLSALGVVKNILQVGYVKIFGTGSGFGIFLGSLITILGFTFAMLIWRAWAGRMPN